MAAQPSAPTAALEAQLRRVRNPAASTAIAAEGEKQPLVDGDEPAVPRGPGVAVLRVAATRTRGPEATGREDNGPGEKEYLTLGEAATYLRIAPGTLRNKMTAGLFHLGTHYVRPPGLGPRFKRNALQRWLEGAVPHSTKQGPLGDVPMARNSLTRPRVRQ